MKGNRTRTWRGMGAGLAAGVCIFCTVGWAYEPPEILAVLDFDVVADEVIWIGDINRDGYDDLMLGVDPDNDEGHRNEVHIYLGGEEFSTEPAYVLRHEEGGEFGRTLNYLGFIIGGNLPTFAIWAGETGNIPASIVALIDDEFSTLLEFNRRGESYGPWLSSQWDRGIKSKPMDLNGDGYHDFILPFFAPRSAGHYEFHFGGEEIDTIPNLTYDPPKVSNSVTSGFDVNGDGFDDVILWTDDRMHSLFLGGEEFDTIPDLQMEYAPYQWEGWEVGSESFERFFPLTDLNGDGFDEWGAAVKQKVGEDWDGSAITVSRLVVFWGSEHPSLADRTALVNYNNWRGGFFVSYEFLSGDFNGDGYGDVVNTWGDHRIVVEGHMAIFFGSRWGLQDSTAQLIYSLGEDLGEDYFGIGGAGGALGDYNGDGADDFIVGGYIGSLRVTRWVIMAGNRNWRLNTPELEPTIGDFTISSFPNPVNSILHVDIYLPSEGDLILNIYDIKGQEITGISLNTEAGGEHHFQLDVTPLTSGIYFLTTQLKSGGDIRYGKPLKIVVLK